MKLTKARIEKATYEGRRYVGKDGRERFSRFVLWDDEVRGFGLRITPAGYKSFVLSYRVHGRKKLMKLGVFGQITLKQARNKARRELGLVADGGDPLQARQDQRRQEARAVTMAELVELYEELYLPKLKPATRRSYQSALRSQVLPALGSRRVDDLTQQDIARLHVSMQPTPAMANHTVTVLSGVFKLAEAYGLREKGSNPCRGIKHYKETRRERFLSTEELKRLGRVLAEASEERSVHPSVILAIRLLLLTGARKSEIVHLRWDEVSFERRCLRLSDSKTGEKTILLSSAALELLAQAPRVESNPYVCFGPREGKPFVSLGQSWRRVRELAGLEDVRLHDLRHSFASVAAMGGLSLPMIGGLLGHSRPETTARYAHLAANPLHAAAEQISGEILAALNHHEAGQEAEPPPRRSRDGRHGRPERP